MSNYASMAKRIRNCRSLPECERAGTSLVRLYDNGVLTVSELQRLDDLLFHVTSSLDV